jgi:hypothetical protein
VPYQPSTLSRINLNRVDIYPFHVSTPSTMSEYADWFVYDEQFELLICTPCGVVMPRQGSGLGGHLEYCHNSNAEQFVLKCNE